MRVAGAVVCVCRGVAVRCAITGSAGALASPSAFARRTAWHPWRGVGTFVNGVSRGFVDTMGDLAGEGAGGPSGRPCAHAADGDRAHDHGRMNGGRCFALVLGAPAPSPALRRSGGAPVGTGGSAWVGAWLACHEGFVDMTGRLGRRGRRRSQLTALRGGSAWTIKDRSCAHFDARQRSRGDAPKRTTIASLQVSGIARPRRGYSRRTESLPLSACRHGYSGRDTRASRTRRSGQIQRLHAGHLRISRTGRSCSARPLALVPRPRGCGSA